MKKVDRLFVQLLLGLLFFSKVDLPKELFASLFQVAAQTGLSVCGAKCRQTQTYAIPSAPLCCL